MIEDKICIGDICVLCAPGTGDINVCGAGIFTDSTSTHPKVLSKLSDTHQIYRDHAFTSEIVTFGVEGIAF